MMTVISFVGFTAFVAFYAWFRLRKDKLDSSDGYFLGGRSMTGIVIAGSMLLTNISTEHLVGMNGSSYKNGFIIIGWEVTSAIALVVAALYSAAGRVLRPYGFSHHLARDGGPEPAAWSQPLRVGLCLC